MDEVFSAKNIIGIVVGTLLVTITGFLATKACKWAWPRVEKGWRTWALVGSVSAPAVIGCVHYVWLRLPGHTVTATDITVIYMVIALAVLSILNLVGRLAEAMRDATRAQVQHVGITQELAKRAVEQSPAAKD